MNQITNNRIYDIYCEIMDQPVPYGHHRDIRNFARAIIKADRALRSENQTSAPVEARQFTGAKMALFLRKAGVLRTVDQIKYIAEREIESSSVRCGTCDKCGLINGCSVGCGDE